MSSLIWASKVCFFDLKTLPSKIIKLPRRYAIMMLICLPIFSLVVWLIMCRFINLVFLTAKNEKNKLGFPQSLLVPYRKVGWAVSKRGPKVFSHSTNVLP